MTEIPVVVTLNAAKRILDIIASEPKGTFFRVAVEGGGCSGFKYKFDLTRDTNQDDIILETEGAKILIDRISLGFLTGSEIDFVDDLMGASFQIKNPQAISSCGCGVSFSL
ncbi:MAG: HesB/IscA family protein [Hyphomicrobium sp.]